MMRILADENVHVDIISALRSAGHEVLFVPEIGLRGRKDREILDYSERHDLVVISGDKDFGGLIEFGPLWGREKVVLLRYRFMNAARIADDIARVLKQELQSLKTKRALVLVLSESGYRVRRPARGG